MTDASNKADRLTWTIATIVANFAPGTVFAASNCALAGIRLSQELLGCRLALCSRGGAYDPRGPLSLHARWWLFNRRPRAYIDLKDVFDTLSEPHALLATPAQVDGACNANLSGIGAHDAPKVAFGGTRGLPDPQAIHFVMPGYNKRQLVDAVSFVSTRGASRQTPALLITEDMVMRWDAGRSSWLLEAIAKGTDVLSIADRVGFAFDSAAQPRILDELPATAAATLNTIDPHGLRNFDFMSDRAAQFDAMERIYAAEAAQIGPEVVPIRRSSGNIAQG